MGRSFRASDSDLARAGAAIAQWARFKHNTRTLFGDMLEIWTIALQNGFMPRDTDWLKREKRYAELKASFDGEGYDLMTELFAKLTAISVRERGDWLGELYHQLEINSKASAQFFTPFGVSSMMAAMTFTKDAVEKAVAEKGFIGMQEPACGAGGMVIAAAQAIEALGYNPKQVLRVHAIDVDRLPVMMTFIQTTLQGVPCFVEQANSLDPASSDQFNYRLPNVHFASCLALAA